MFSFIGKQYLIEDQAQLMEYFFKKGEVFWDQ